MSKHDRRHACPAAAPEALRSEAIGDLRAFVTALVVAYHAALAYVTFLPPAPVPMALGVWRIFPIVDAERWRGFDLFFVFNNTFFMSLMFFLSGLFVIAGLERKGSAGFLKSRAMRLGLPFAFGALIVTPLAFYASWRASGASLGPIEFWWKIIPDVAHGAAGPMWFLWMLLVFDAIAAVVHQASPTVLRRLALLFAGADRHPALLFALLTLVSAIAYVPLAASFGPDAWSAIGPFAYQLARPAHYAVYFFFGAGVGAHGWRAGLLSRQGNLARRWGLWAVLALIAFVYLLGAALKAQGAAPTSLHALIRDLALGVSCAASSFFLLGVFVRFVRGHSRIAKSWRDNAYAVYIVHYAIVAWVQFMLLPAALSGLEKGLIAIIGSLALSWIAAIALRQIPGVARIV